MIHNLELINSIFLLFVIFQVKHFIMDYFLQVPWMLQKFRADWGFFFPLLAHAGAHAVVTLGICILFVPSLWWLAFIDLITHFMMDRIKAGPKYLGRFKALSAKEYMQTVKDEMAGDEITFKEIDRKRKHNFYFYLSLGFDQLVHHLSDLVIIYFLIIGV